MCIAILALLVASPPAPADDRHLADARQLVVEIPLRYAYFEEIEDAWPDASEDLLARAELCASNAEFIALLEDFVRLFADDHSFLGMNLARSPRLVPSGIDVWPRWDGDRLVVESVRPGSAAWRNGLRPGTEIVSIGGVVPDDLALERLHPGRDPDEARARDWAARQCVAGPRNEPLELVVRDESGERALFHTPAGPDLDGPMTARVVDGGIGLITIHDSLGDLALVGAFDRALEELKDTRALVIDLRSTASGGNTTVARGLMGRLVRGSVPYQRHELIEEERRYGIRRIWVERVVERGPFVYERPVVLLVGRWTGSMGEGVAIGLAGAGRARLVGTRMAGLRGAIDAIRLRETNIPVLVPIERLSDVDGVPREDTVPDVLVPSDGAPAGSTGDATLAAAIRWIEAR